MPLPIAYRQTLRRFRRPVFGIVQLMALALSILPPSSFTFGNADNGDVISLSVSPTDASVQENGTTTVTARLWDETTQTPAAGVFIYYFLSGGGSLNASGGTTDGNGYVTLTFTGGAQPATVTVADASGWAPQATCTIGVTTPPPQETYGLTLWTEGGTAVPGQPTPLYAWLRSTTTGAAVTGAVVNFAVVTGTGHLDAVSATTDGSGVCAVPFVGNTASSELTAWDANGLASPVSVTVGVGTPLAYDILFSADSSSLDPGQSMTLNAQLVASDGSQVFVVPGATLNFSIPAGDGALSSYSGVTNTQGVVSMTFTGGSSPSQINGWDAMGYGASSTCVVGATVPPPAYSLSIAAAHNPLQQRQATTLGVSLTQTGSGSPVSGATIYFQVGGGTVTMDDATLGALSATTDGDGYCEIPVTSGAVSSLITAWDVSGYGTSNSLTLSVPSSTDSLSLTLSPQQNPLLPGEGTTITATVTDTTLGLPVSGVVLNLFQDGTPWGSQVTTGEDGTCVIPFTGGGSPVTVQAQDASGLNLSQSLVMGVGHRYSISLGTPDPSTLQLYQTTQLSAQVYDQTAGTWAVGVPVSFAMMPGSSGWLTQNSSTTDQNGCCTATLMGGGSTASIMVTAADDHSTDQTYTIGGYTVNDTVALTAWTGQSSLLSGNSVQLFAQLWDNTTGLPVSGGTVSFHVDSGPGKLGANNPDAQTTVDVSTDPYGNCSVWFTGGAGPSTVSISNAYAGGPATQDFTVVEEHYRLSVSSEHTTLAPGASAPLVAGLWNIEREAYVRDVPLHFVITTGNGSVSPGSATTGSDGTCTVDVTGGTSASTLTVTDAFGYAAPFVLPFQVQTAGSYALTLSAIPTTLAPGAQSTIHALLMDDSTPPAPKAGVVVNFSVPSDTTVGYGTLSATSAVTDEYGRCSVNFIGGTTATTVTASDDAGYGTSSTCGFSVVTDPTYRLTNMQPGNPWKTTVILSTPLSVTLVDDDSVPVSGKIVTFTILSGDGSLQSASAETNTNGIATVWFTFGDHTTTVKATALGAWATYTFQEPTGGSCTCGHLYCAGALCTGVSDPSTCACAYLPPPTCQCSQPNCPGGDCACSNDCQGQQSCTCKWTTGDNPSCSCTGSTKCTNGECGPCKCPNATDTQPCACPHDPGSSGCGTACVCKCGGGLCDKTKCPTPNGCGGNADNCSCQCLGQAGCGCTLVGEGSYKCDGTMPRTECRRCQCGNAGCPAVASPPADCTAGCLPGQPKCDLQKCTPKCSNTKCPDTGCSCAGAGTCVPSVVALVGGENQGDGPQYFAADDSGRRSVWVGLAGTGDYILDFEHSTMTWDGGYAGPTAENVYDKTNWHHGGPAAPAVPDSAGMQITAPIPGGVNEVKCELVFKKGSNEHTLTVTLDMTKLTQTKTIMPANGEMVQIKPNWHFVSGDPVPGRNWFK